MNLSPGGGYGSSWSTPATIRGIATPEAARSGTGLQSTSPTFGGTTWNTTKTVKTHVHSANATVKRESNDLRKQISTLTRQHEKALKAADDFREEVRRMRATSDAKDRELHMIRRQLERVGHEKQHVEMREETDKAYVRKLEAKVATGLGSVQQEGKLGQLRGKLKDAQTEIDNLRQDLSAERLEAAQQAQEVKALQHALNLRAEELDAGGGKDVHSKLLYAVGKGREEGVALAVQLADRAEALKKAEEGLALQREQVEELAYIKEANGQELLQLERLLAAAREQGQAKDTEIVRLMEEASAAEERRSLLEAELDHMRRDLAEERGRRARLAEALEASEQAAATEAEALRGEVQIAAQRAEAQGREERMKAERRLEAEQERSHELLGEVERERTERARAVEACKQEVSAERARAEATSRAAEEAASVAALKERELMDEVGNLHSEIEAFTEVNERLQGQWSDAQTATRTESLRVSNLQQQVATLEAQLGVLRSEKASGDSALKGRMEATLGDLQGVMGERDRLRAALNEAMSKCASLSTTEEALRAEVAQGRELSDNLARSKDLLQRTLMDQLAEARRQLDAVNHLRRELEGVVDRQRDDADRLQAQVEQERRATAALTRHYEASTAGRSPGAGGALGGGEGRRSPPSSYTPLGRATGAGHSHTPGSYSRSPPRSSGYGGGGGGAYLDHHGGGGGGGDGISSILGGSSPPRTGGMGVGASSSSSAAARLAEYRATTSAAAEATSRLTATTTTTTTTASTSEAHHRSSAHMSSGVASMLSDNQRLLAEGGGAAGGVPTLEMLASSSSPYDIYGDHGGQPLEMM